MVEVDEGFAKVREFLQNKDYRSALNKTEELSQFKLNKNQRFENTLHKGIAKMNLSLYQDALPDLEAALALGEKNEDRYQQALALHQLGIITKLLGDYPKATELFREELRRCSSLIPSYYSDLSYNFFEQGDVKMLSEEYEDAEMYFHHAVTFAETEHNYHGVGLAMQALGHLKLRLNQTEDALNYFKTSKENFELADSHEEVAIVSEEIERLQPHVG